MDCPIDGTRLQKRIVRSTILEECLQCRGLWFDEGELRKTKDEVDPDLNWLDFDLWSDSEALKADWSARKCPKCGINMATISYDSTEVKVDTCPDGHGVWLDKGEFEAILAALENEVSTKNVSEYFAASLVEARDILFGREGFLSEWKDFLTVTRLLQYRVLVENPKLTDLLIALQRTNPLK